MTEGRENIIETPIPRDIFSDLIDLGDYALWSLSSFKPGNGVDQLRHTDVDQFWQSDGCAPHTVTLKFRKLVAVKVILSIFTDINRDETYTPRLISIRAGTSMNVLEEVLRMELEDPIGWFHYSLEDSTDQPLFCHVIQFCILSNHHNGKDCHLRGLKVWGPKEKDPTDRFSIIPFTDEVFQMYSTVR